MLEERAVLELEEQQEAQLQVWVRLSPQVLEVLEQQLGLEEQLVLRV